MFLPMDMRIRSFFDPVDDGKFKAFLQKRKSLSKERPRESGRIFFESLSYLIFSKETMGVLGLSALKGTLPLQYPTIPVYNPFLP